MKRLIQLSLIWISIISLISCVNNKEQEIQTSIVPTNSSDSLNKSVIAYFNQPDKSIYILTDFKYKKKLITVEDGNITWPIYSPDGNRIAFTGTIKGVQATYTINAENGKDLKIITSPKGELHEGVLDWHTDGSLICVTKNLDGKAEIYTVIDSTNMKNITNHKHWDFFPLSHSENIISFWTSRDDSLKDSKQYDYQSVYTVNTDGSNLTKKFQISEMTNESVGNGIFPAISPDGKTYVFMMNLDLYSINMDGSNLKNLTQSKDIGEYFPFFSTINNKRIFYSSHDTISPSLNIYSIDIEGNNKKQHTFFEDEKSIILYPKFKPTLPNNT